MFHGGIAVSPQMSQSVHINDRPVIPCPMRASAINLFRPETLRVRLDRTATDTSRPIEFLGAGVGEPHSRVFWVV